MRHLAVCRTLVVPLGAETVRIEDRLSRFAEGQVAMAVASLRETTFGGVAYDSATSSVKPAKIDQRKTFKIDALGAQAGVAEQIVSALKAYDRDLNRTLGERMDNYAFNNALRR